MLFLTSMKPRVDNSYHPSLLQMSETDCRVADSNAHPRYFLDNSATRRNTLLFPPLQAVDLRSAVGFTISSTSASGRIEYSWAIDVVMSEGVLCT